MRPDEYIAFDGFSLAELVRRGEVAARAFTEAAIERIDSLNGRLNAVVERGFAQALACLDLIGDATPLGGVPRRLADRRAMRGAARRGCPAAGIFRMARARTALEQQVG
jgi:Asp-tRNA(Asn)/Glu-tRNA(Gln) amidotransferase A subunit family amidase